MITLINFRNRQRVSKETGQASSSSAGRSNSGGFPFSAPQLSARGFSFVRVIRPTASAEQSTPAVRDASVGSGMFHPVRISSSRWIESSYLGCRAAGLVTMHTTSELESSGRLQSSLEIQRTLQASARGVDCCHTRKAVRPQPGKWGETTLERVANQTGRTIRTGRSG
jgi:hypothetical protein